MPVKLHHDTDSKASNGRMVTKLLFRLLPVQILLAAISAVNGVVSGLFASNFVGETAMSAVALFGPINMLVYSISFMLFSGATILCGTYMGRNQFDKVQGLFSVVVSVLGMAMIAVFDWSGFLTRDEAVRPVFNAYLLGQAIGELPYILGNQLSAFLSMENKIRRTTTAGLALIVVNLLLNVLFVTLFRWGAFGLALASSLALWVFFAVEAEYFLSGKSQLRFDFKHIAWRESGAYSRRGIQRLSDAARSHRQRSHHSLCRQCRALGLCRL